MRYAEYDDVTKRYSGSASQESIEDLLEEAGMIIDAYNEDADWEPKKVVSIRMVVRALGSADVEIPIGASQGTVSALGYSQTWTMAGGTSGELYLTKIEKKMLGCGARIGSYSPLEGLV